MNALKVTHTLVRITEAIECVILAELRMLESIVVGVIERPITYEGRSLIMTAGIKIYT